MFVVVNLLFNLIVNVEFLMFGCSISMICWEICLVYCSVVNLIGFVVLFMFILICWRIFLCFRVSILLMSFESFVVVVLEVVLILICVGMVKLIFIWIDKDWSRFGICLIKLKVGLMGVNFNDCLVRFWSGLKVMNVFKLLNLMVFFRSLCKGVLDFFLVSIVFNVVLLLIRIVLLLIFIIRVLVLLMWMILFLCYLLKCVLGRF